MESRASSESESHKFPEHRQAMRTGVLTGLGEVVVVNLGSQTGLLLDLAKSGLAVQAVYPVARNASVDVCFPLPFTGTLIGAICRVAWADDGGRAGLAFLRVDDADRRQLDTWLAKHREGNLRLDAAPDAEPVGDELLTGSPQLGETGSAQCAAHASVPPRLEQIATAQAPPMLFNEAVTRACHLTGADGAAVVLCGPEGAVCNASTGEAPEVGSKLQSKSGFTAECLRTGKVVLCSDVDNDPRAQLATVKRLRLRSVLIVPILAGSSVTGALEVLSTRPGAFGIKDATMLQPIADIIAAAVSVPDETPPRISRFEHAFFEAKKATTSLLNRTRLPFSVAGRITSLSLARAGFELKQATRSFLTRARAVVRPHLMYAGIAWLALAVAGALLVGSRWWNRAPVPGVSDTNLLSEHPPATQPGIVSKTEAHSSLPVERRPLRRNENSANRVRAGKSSYVDGDQTTLSLPSSSGARRNATGADDTVVVRNSGLASAGTSKPTSSPQPVSNEATAGNFIEKPIPLGTPGSYPQESDLLANLVSAGPPPLPRLAPPSQRLRASEVIEGEAISLPLPKYPEEARRRGVQGSVFVRNVIDVNGRIKQLAVLEGDPILAQPAIDAVKQWRYAPTYLNRIPVETETVDELKFAVTDKASEVSTPLHLPKDLKRGRLIAQSMPVYPEAARRMQLQGTVVVQALLGVDGSMKQLRQLSGNYLLGQAAMQALKKWRYEPSYREGKPVEVNTTIVVNFNEH